MPQVGKNRGLNELTVVSLKVSNRSTVNHLSCVWKRKVISTPTQVNKSPVLIYRLCSSQGDSSPSSSSGDDLSYDLSYSIENKCISEQFNISLPPKFVPNSESAAVSIAG